jgi:DNA uptake protein ComE-like DNA-binding protein
LDPNETHENPGGTLDSGIFEWVTPFTREPNYNRTNITDPSQLADFLQQKLGSEQARMLARNPQVQSARSILEFLLASGLSSSDLVKIADGLTTTNAAYLEGRVNINTASREVLSCIPGIGPDKADQVISYRQSHPDQLGTVAWIISALQLTGRDATNFARQAGSYITVRSYQYSADIAALGPNGRGYKRVRYVFDLSDGTPKIIYRQDLTHLGWALGREVRQNWLRTPFN